MNRSFSTLLGAIAVVLVAIGILWYVTGGATAPASTSSTVPPAGAITIQGTMTCLPHKGTGPHTMECAFGLEGDDGTYYGLSEANPGSLDISSIPTGSRVEVAGTFAPGEDETYATVGTISATRITPLGTSASSSPQTTSDGTISFTTPSDFGLATTPEQVLVTAYIPPCDQGFEYCLYYNGSAYQGTNFESAGLAIRTRPDLDTQSACLTTEPEGYSGLHATTTVQTSYAMSVLGPVGDAGAGHYATGNEYRLFTSGACYQLDTRIGETQYANYPAGTITQFTDAERAALFSTLRGIVRSITLVQDGTSLTLPQ